MAKQTIGVTYDDAGFPSVAATAAAVTLGALTTVKAAPGRLLKVIVTTVTAAAVATVYDSSAAAAGTPLLVIPVAAAVGTVYDVNLPAAAGITIQSTGATGAVTVGYS